jgi:hypothetical protein
VKLHGVLGYCKLPRDVLVGGAFGKQGHYLEFTSGQWFDCSALKDSLRISTVVEKRNVEGC